MSLRPECTAIVGATGPTGFHLALELAGRGWKVRAVSRRREALERLFAGPGSDQDPELGSNLELAVGDALDPESLGRAVAGAELIVDCIGLPPERMADHPRTARNVAAAARAEGARSLQVSSYWSFFPHRGEVVSEEHPREGGHQWFRWRREAEDVLLEAGAAVVHLPDFFGPEVHTSAVQMALEEALAGKPVSALGDPDAAREIAYVPDAMRLVADLAGHREAYGTDWAIPGNGTASARDLARIAGEHLGREVKVRAVPPWLIRILALVVPSLRPVVPLAPHYARPVRYDASKLARLLGPIDVTPLPDAVRATLDRLR
jgi:nucleoside-diphosphate-sugar epimerase